MKIIAIIPARYNSTRFKGKPLADICGKPMIWWVYNTVIKVKRFNDVIIATDDEKIARACSEFEMKYIMTSNKHPNHIYRIHELSEKIEADLYVCVNGDEPLIEENAINKIINEDLISNEKPCVFGLMRNLEDPVETLDPDNIKIVTNKKNYSLYMSRSIVPFPKKNLLFKYKKYVGVEGFNKKALDFFVKTPQGILEKIEDIDHLRFIENGISIKYSLIKSKSLSVDTPKDLEKVRRIIGKRLKNGEITNE